MNIIKWVRRCQECGAKGFYTKPNTDNKSESWRNTKCRKCKSEALDFGKEVVIDDITGLEVENSYDE